MAILSICIGGRIGLELKLTGFNRDSTAAFYLAKAGVERAVSQIEKEDHSTDSLNEAWSNNDEEKNPLFRQIGVGDTGDFTVSYRYYDGRVFYGVQDEQRLVNINVAPRNVIARLIECLDQGNDDAEEIAADLSAWRKDKRFDSIDEVLLVESVDEALFDKLKGSITVYPLAGTPGINVNTAPFPVLCAVGFSDADAEAVIKYRAGPDGLEGTDNDALFDKISFADFLAKLPKESADMLVYSSRCFRIKSSGETANKRARKDVTCVVSGREILFWNEE